MTIGIDGNEANINRRVGSNIYAYKLLEGFQKLDSSNNFIVYLKSQAREEMPPTSMRWKYHTLQPKAFWTRFRLPLELFLNRSKISVFFTPGHYAPKYSPVPLAVSVMDLSYLYYPEMFKKGDLYKLMNWTADSIKRADHIFTISNFNKTEIVKYYQVPEEIITVTYPGLGKPVSSARGDDEFLSLKEKLNIPDKYLLYLGTLQPRKNIVKMIQAFSMLDQPDVYLVIAGKKGWHYKDIFETANKSGVSDRIIFTGYVTDNIKWVLLKKASALVLVSLYEGFGIPVAEAMQVGTPVVISNASSLPEITGEVGIQVDPGLRESIASGLSKAVHLNESQRKQLAMKSKKIAERYSWENATKKTLEVLYELAI